MSPAKRRLLGPLTARRSMAAVNAPVAGRSAERAQPVRQELTHTGRALILLGVTAVAAEAVLWIAGGPGAAAVGAGAIAVAALAVARYVGGADAFDGGYRKPVRLVHQREPSLQGWATTVDAALNSGAAFNRLFRPEIERLYAVRLAERYGVSMHAEPERAAALVGPEVWPWIDPRRPEPSLSAPRRVLDRRALDVHLPPPPPAAVIEVLVRRLETL